MVEVRYIHKRGKKFGPYYYHTYRKNGKVKKFYIGSEEDYAVWKNERSTTKDNFGNVKAAFSKLSVCSIPKQRSQINGIVHNWKLALIPVILLVLILGLFIYLNPIGISGHAVLDIQNTYLAGENISGDLKLVLKSGELLPADTKIVVEPPSGTKEFLLSDFFGLTSGEYYAEGYNISGQGEGVGFAGEKVIYSNVYFTLLLSDDEQEGVSNVSGEGASEETSNETQTPTIPTQNETPTEQPTVPSESVTETPITPTETSTPILIETPTEIPITPTTEIPAEITMPAETPGESPIESTPAEVSAESPITGAVILQGEQEVEAVVSKSQNFEYNTNKQASVIKAHSDYENLSSDVLNLVQENGKVIVSTDYSYTEKGFGKEYLGNENELKLSLDKLNLKAENGALRIRLVYGKDVFAEESKEINVENLTEKIGNETLINKTGNETIKRYSVVINHPVKWQKKISVENLSEISVELPKGAENISIKTGDEIAVAEQQAQQEENIIPEDKSSLITGDVVAENSGGGVLSKVWKKLIGSITGHVTEEVNNIVETNDSKIISINLDKTTDEILVEYITPGPVANETNLSNGKKMILSAQDELNYTDILAYSELDNKISIENKNEIKIYHLVNDTRESVEFDAYDLDEDGNIDYIEWNVPHLSEQVYEIIYITKAEHLDSGRNLVEDVYAEVREKDNNWTTIPSGEYIRVTFEKNLTNKNDITIYVRAGSVNNETECYDNETQIMTSEGWKYFADLKDNEKVATLNNNTGKMEWQIPSERQVYDNSIGYIYNIETEEGNLSVSKEHKVYSAENNAAEAEYTTSLINVNSNLNNGDNLIKDSVDKLINENSYSAFNSSEICFVEMPIPILNNKSSYVHNLMPLDKQSATKASSLICVPKSSFALGINDSYSSNGIKVILLNNNDSNSTKSSLDNLDFSSISSLCFINSSFNFSGASISKESLKIINSISPAEISVLKNILESITTSIHTKPLLTKSSCIDLLTLSASSLASFSVNLDFATIFLNFSNASLVSSCFNSSCLANSDQTIQTNLASLAFNSSSIANVIDAIYILPSFFNFSNFSSSSTFLIIALRTTSATLTSGNFSLKSFNNLSGTCTVILNDFAILTPCSVREIRDFPEHSKVQREQQGLLNIYVDRSNYANVYKSFGFDDRLNNLYNGNKKENPSYSSMDRAPVPLTANDKNNNYIKLSDNGSDEQLINVNLSSFSLQKITDVYSDFNSGKKVYFLNSENKPIKVKSITRENYTGKIYDVDVPNDIVLVKRGNSQAIWSGNSNPVRVEVYWENDNNILATFNNITDESWHKIYLTALGNESRDVFDLKSFGDVEYDYVVDPTIAENIVPNANLINVTAEGNFTHLNISTTAPYDGLVGYWNFDGDKENAQSTKHYDWTKNNYDGTGYQNVVVNSTGCIYGDCANFDGNGDYVEIPSLSSMNYVTISTWIKTTQTPADNAQIIQRDQPTGRVWQFRMLADGTFQVIPFDTGGNPGFATSSTIINDGNWHHIASTWDGTTVRNYVDGVANGTGLLSGTLATAAIPIQIGTPDMPGRAWTGGVNFLGSLDEIMIFNTALTSAQILAIYNNQSERFANQGTQDIINQSYMNITAGNDRVNVITSIENLLGSSINLSVGYYNTSWSYTSPQVVSSGAVQTFNISSTSTNLTLNYTFYAGTSTNHFYSPIIKEYIVFTAWNVDTIPPAINFTYPTPANGSSQTGTSIYVNISSNDSNEHYVVNNFDNSLMGWWRGEGNANSDTGINNGTLQGNANATATGKFNSSFGFDGTGDYVEIPSINMNYVTISTWIKTIQTPVDNAQIIQRDYSDGRVWQFRITSAGKLEFIPFNTIGANGDAVSTTSINDGNWHHVASTWDGTTVRNYVDGVANGTSLLSGTLATYQKVIQIGAPNGAWTGGDYFNGPIDEVLIFNRSLSAQEILALYNAGANQYYNNFTDLAVGQHNFTGYAVDTSGNKNQTETRSVIINGPDTIYPTFSNYLDNNASLVGSGIALFNVTLANTNGTVFLQINNTNYTATNLTSNMYNASVSLTNGTYSYYWGSWGNGTSHLYNVSATRSYTVNNTDINPPVISNARINASSSVKINTVVKVNASVVDSEGHLDSVKLEIIPPVSGAYNTTLIQNGNEFYNSSIILNEAGQWQFRFYSNDTFGNNAIPLFAKDQLNNDYINVQVYGNLSVILISPIGSNSQPQNQSFVVRVNVSCVGEAGDICGTVNGSIRYNVSSSNPDSLLSGSDVYDTPFYVIESNPQTCGELNVGDNPCNLSFNVNTTGDIGESYKLDVNFTSDAADITSNNSDFTTIRIVSPILSIILSDDLMNIDFGASLNPGTSDNPAVYNPENAYNLTCMHMGGSCNVSIKGNYDLVYNINTIGIGNISWNWVNDTISQNSLSSSYNVINSSLANSATQFIYFWLDVPVTQVAGDYKSNFTIYGESA